MPAAPWFRAEQAFVLAGSILKHQEDLFAAELHRLKQQPLFSLVDFENLMDGIRSTVAEVSARHAIIRRVSTSGKPALFGRAAPVDADGGGGKPAGAAQGLCRFGHFRTFGSFRRWGL